MIETHAKVRKTVTYRPIHLCPHRSECPGSRYFCEPRAAARMSCSSDTLIRSRSKAHSASFASAPVSDTPANTSRSTKRTPVSLFESTKIASDLILSGRSTFRARHRGQISLRRHRSPGADGVEVNHE